MFNKDFYPTPENVIYQMIGGLDLTDAVVLEPSAGSGKVSLVKLFKPQVFEDDFDYSIFFEDEDAERRDVGGVMRYDKLRAIVERYVYTIKEFVELEKHLKNINNANKSRLSLRFSEEKVFKIIIQKFCIIKKHFVSLL